MVVTESKRILIVDDNPSIHQDYLKILGPKPDEDESAITAFLGTSSAEVTPTLQIKLDSAYSGEEALQKAKEANLDGKPYAVAFVDMRMPPGWDGLRTTEELWAVSPDLQIVICTAYSDNSWNDIVAKVGVTDQLLILKKPFDSIEVSQLASALTQKWQLSKEARLKRAELEQLVEERTRKLQHAALHDPLTDLPNRRQFQTQISRALENRHDEELVGLLLIDLDRFKQINDSMGHPAGDALLIEVADCLLKEVNESQVARLGGDEFAVILRGTRAETEILKAKAETITHALAKPHLIEGAEIHCGASTGLALAPPDATDIEELIRNADVALYRAKQEGHSLLRVYSDEADAQKRDSRLLECDISQTTDEAFDLHFQPILNSRTEQIACIEAFVRWQHPRKGLLLPEEFLAIIEDCGRVQTLGDWIIRQACQTAANWPSQIHLALNVSALQLQKGNRLLQTIVDALAESGLEAERLELEFCDGDILSGQQNAREILCTLRDMGITIVLDDFGMGYSTLDLLRTLPFNKLKLDEAFVQSLEHNADARVIVDSVALLGQQLGIQTSAEGVENEGQRNAILKAGFDFWQGYALTQPIPEDELTALLHPRPENASL